MLTTNSKGSSDNHNDDEEQNENHHEENHDNSEKEVDQIYDYDYDHEKNKSTISSMADVGLPQSISEIFECTSALWLILSRLDTGND